MITCSIIYKAQFSVNAVLKYEIGKKLIKKNKK